MSEAAKAGQPLDDVMLAMDVVDTLRHQQLLVERELAADDRDEKMKARLREIYASQGIEVPDHVLEQGVSALREGRFVYRPPSDGPQVRLARLYVSRGRWGRPVLLFTAAVLLVWLAFALLIKGPSERASAALPKRVEAQYEVLAEIAVGPLAVRESKTLLQEGRDAVRRDDESAAELALERMATLQADIEREYELRISNRPGERSGVWRVPDTNPGARNYYIIVEAIDHRGEPVKVQVVNEEDGKRHRVNRWGLRVEESLFQQVAADKTDDGIIQNNRFGVKKRGYLEPRYLMPTTGDAVTRW